MKPKRCQAPFLALLLLCLGLADSPVATEIITSDEIANSSAATLSEALDDYGIRWEKLD
jgi:hypothetical protein